MARSKRLTFIASLTKGYHTVLDIGTDHGLVLKKAFDLGFITHGIAADIKEKPLNQAKRNLKKYQVDYVLSDGFKAIHQPFDLAIIAGMGAYTICDILKDAPKKDITLILQANDRHEHLRTFLADHQFQLINEYIIDDGFYYVIMVVRYGNMTLSKEDAFLGPILKHKIEAIPYYQQQLRQFKRIVTKADEMKKQEIQAKIDVLKGIL